VNLVKAERYPRAAAAPGPIALPLSLRLWSRELWPLSGFTGSMGTVNVVGAVDKLSALTVPARMLCCACASTVGRQSECILGSAVSKHFKTFTFTFRVFGRRFYPKRLTKSPFVERDSNISLWYIKIRIEQVSSIHNCKVNRTVRVLLTRLIL